jgi:hypothetical protein
MALVFVTFGQAGHYSGAGGHQPVFTGPARTVTVTTSSSAAPTSISAGVGEIAKIVADGDVIVSAHGAASATNGVFVQADVAEWIGCVDGQPLSLIDA